MTETRPKPEYLLRIDNLVVRYARSAAPAVQGVSLDLHPGEIVALIGPSGAGKSTLLRAVQRLVEPESGRVLLGGTEITSLSRRELRRARSRMGMIFQDHALVERLTVMENVLCGTLGRVSFWPSVRRRFPPTDVDEAFRLLDRVGLNGFEDRRCDELSGGQKQRVGIARAIIQHPDVLLVDEPTASLDPATSARIMSLLTAVCEERRLAAIINLHDVPLARRFCRRIVGMSDGRLISDTSAAQLDEDLLRRIYGDEGGAEAASNARGLINDEDGAAAASSARGLVDDEGGGEATSSARGRVDDEGGTEAAPGSGAVAENGGAKKASSRAGGALDDEVGVQGAAGAAERSDEQTRAALERGLPATERARRSTGESS